MTAQRIIPRPGPTIDQPREDMVLLDTDYSLDDFGIAILASIAKGQHSEQAILREYIQNSIDATNREELAVLENYEPEVVISVQGRSIFVYDNGIGMDWEGIDRAKAIAISEKAALAVVQGGFRGIGLWSGLGIAEQLVVRTTMLGDSCEYILEIDFAEISKLTNTTQTIRALERFVRIYQRTAEADDHYTLVQLKNIASPYFEFFENTEDIVTYISGHLPVRFNPKFSHSDEIVNKLTDYVADFAFADVRVDGKSIFNLYTDDLNIEGLQYSTLKHEEDTLAFMWYCIRSKNSQIDNSHLRNLAIKAKGYQVGSRGYLLQTITDANLLNWYTGEVHIIHPDLRPDVKRMELDTTPAKKWLEHELENKAGELTQFARRRSANVNCKNRLDDTIIPFINELETQLDTELKLSEVTSFLEKLNTHLVYICGKRGLENKYIKGDPDSGIVRNSSLIKELNRAEVKLRKLKAKLEGKKLNGSGDAASSEDKEDDQTMLEGLSTVSSQPKQPSEETNGEVVKEINMTLVNGILTCIRGVVGESEVFVQIVESIQREFNISSEELSMEL